jgi:transposase-like protein
MTSALSAKHLHDEAAAYKWVEARVWPNGRVCPHCGVVDDSGALKGKSTRVGVYKCYSCRKPFTVKVGTIFESSHVKLHIWLQAMHIMASSKKGFSSNQFARTLGVDLKTAWFMSHRIRLAMAPGGALPPLGGEGKVVEVDETYHGKVANPTDLTTKGKPFKNKKAGRGGVNKRPIVALVERGGASAAPMLTGICGLTTTRPAFTPILTARSALVRARCEPARAATSPAPSRSVIMFNCNGTTPAPSRATQPNRRQDCHHEIAPPNIRSTPSIAGGSRQCMAG